MIAKEEVVFKEYLALQQLKETDQRKKILELFLRTKKHLTAEEMHKELEKRKVHVGVSTVYRTMKLLCECNLAREVDFGDGLIRFEHNHNRQHHDHMICVHCGRTIEFYNDVIEKLQNKIATTNNFQVYRHRLEVFGQCKECQSLCVNIKRKTVLKSK